MNQRSIINTHSILANIMLIVKIRRYPFSPIRSVPVFVDSQSPSKDGTISWLKSLCVLAEKFPSENCNEISKKRLCGLKWMSSSNGYSTWEDNLLSHVFHQFVLIEKRPFSEIQPLKIITQWVELDLSSINLDTSWMCQVSVCSFLAEIFHFLWRPPQYRPAPPISDAETPQHSSHTQLLVFPILSGIQFCQLL